MKQQTAAVVASLMERYPALAGLEDAITAAIQAVIACYKAKGKLLMCGNGGSAADAYHMAGELMKGFMLPRPMPQDVRDRLRAQYPDDAPYLCENLQVPLTAISLVGETALITACANDQVPDLIFAQQVYGHGNAGDILLAISTSGNSKNVLYAAKLAKTLGLQVIALTGQSGGALRGVSDILINVPLTQVYQIQELHLPVYHAICQAVEREFFGE